MAEAVIQKKVGNAPGNDIVQKTRDIKSFGERAAKKLDKPAPKADDKKSGIVIEIVGQWRSDALQEIYVNRELPDLVPRKKAV